MTTPTPVPNPAIETVIVPRARDLGDGFTVRRALPAIERRMVGPFVFFDQMGPTRLAPGHGLDVRPHPHIGLATVTYLFEGEILHRDSLGTVQPITPGAVNWMTAGRGIAHSERTPPALRPAGPSLLGLQTWLALPRAHEEAAPGFAHHPAGSLPVIAGEGLTVRLIVGTLEGRTSPVAVFSDTIYADATLAPGARLPVPAAWAERGAYVVEGAVTVAGERFASGQMLVFRAGQPVTIDAVGAARVMLFGGEPMDGPRYLWWNFVASSEARIEQAKADWQAGRFDPVPDDPEFIPLPETPKGAHPARYP